MIKETTFYENSSFNLRDYADALYKVMELLTTLLGSGMKKKDGLQVSDVVLQKLNHHKETIMKSTFVKKTEDALPLISCIANKKQEHFLVISLSPGLEVIASRVITVGLLNESQVHPREVFVNAISDRAHSIILAHNHPSGQPTPSNKDLKTTRQLVEAGKIIGISVLDHIIITKNGFISLSREGLM